MGCGASNAKEPCRQGTAGQDDTPADWPQPHVTREKPPVDRLAELLAKKDYLDQEDHVLYGFVCRCREAIEQGSEEEEEAHNALDHLALDLAEEEKGIYAAFSKFDKIKDQFISGPEIEYMLDYLGFPHGPDDVKQFLACVDVGGDGKISAPEFQQCVGRMGGCRKLFDVRRQQIADHSVDLEQSEDAKNEAVRLQLRECGITEEEQVTWRSVTSGSDLMSAAALDPCQKDAVRHIRNLARLNHSLAMPKLTARFEGLGYTVNDLWMTLAWIRELAPVIIHVDLDKVSEFLKRDTHYRNQFETQSSSGFLDLKVRRKWERNLFGGAYEQAEGFQRPKYGVLNVWNDHRGVLGCEQYGDSYLVLKDVRLRCTFSSEDSGNLPAKRLAVLDHYGHSLLEYSDEELHETVKLSKHGKEHRGDSEAVIEQWGKYKEAQIHGQIDLSKHVERIVAHERHREEASYLEELVALKGWKLTWMNDMKTELEAKSEGRELGKAQYDKALSKVSGELHKGEAEKPPVLE